MLCGWIICKHVFPHRFWFNLPHVVKWSFRRHQPKVRKSGKPCLGLGGGFVFFWFAPWSNLIHVFQSLWCTGDVDIALKPFWFSKVRCREYFRFPFTCTLFLAKLCSYKISIFVWSVGLAKTIATKMPLLFNLVGHWKLQLALIFNGYGLCDNIIFGLHVQSWCKSVVTISGLYPWLRNG